MITVPPTSLICSSHQLHTFSSHVAICIQGLGWNLGSFQRGQKPRNVVGFRRTQASWMGWGGWNIARAGTYIVTHIISWSHLVLGELHKIGRYSPHPKVNGNPGSVNLQRPSLWFLPSIVKFSVSPGCSILHSNSPFWSRLLPWFPRNTTWFPRHSPHLRQLPFTTKPAVRETQNNLVLEHPLATGDGLMAAVRRLTHCTLWLHPQLLQLPSPPFSALPSPSPKPPFIFFYADWLSYLFVSMPSSKSCPGGLIFAK